MELENVLTKIKPKWVGSIGERTGQKKKRIIELDRTIEITVWTTKKKLVGKKKVNRIYSTYGAKVKDFTFVSSQS